VASDIAGHSTSSTLASPAHREYAYAVTYPRFAALAFPLVAIVLALFVFMNFRQPTADGNPARPPRPETSSAPPVNGPSAPGETKAAFDSIYKDAKWGANAEGAGNSGTGSTVAATLIYRTFLQQFLKENNIKSVVDAGCGDWEFSQAIDWTGIDYKGYDIVDAVVEADKKKYAKPNIQFFAANIVDTELPPADLLISKHVLQHLPTADVEKFVKQMKKYKHVLFTNGVHPLFLTARNTDIKPGEYRELDLLRPPFNIPGIKVLTYWDGHHMHQVEHFMPQQ
jgi:SAM-dependent methyltransferase